MKIKPINLNIKISFSGNIYKTILPCQIFKEINYPSIHIQTLEISPIIHSIKNNPLDK